MPMLTRRPYVSFFSQGRAGEGVQQRLLAHAVAQADVIVGDIRQILHHLPRDIGPKTVVTSSFDAAAQDELRERGVALLCGTTPPVLADRHVDPWVLHAMAVAHLGKPPDRIQDEDYLRLLRSLRIGPDGSAPRPRVVEPQGQPRRVRKFAYLYHPPSRRELFSSPALRWMGTLPDSAQLAAERAAARAPIFARSRVHGVVGAGEVEAEGWILYLPTTAHLMEEKGPAHAEARLLEASRLAQRLGATLLGVIAFSRTMTRATRAAAGKVDLPITSGMSFFVSATLWAVKEAALQMGLSRDEDGRALGTALVTGAGEPEGGVAAELLALAFRRLVLVDGAPDRLRSLSERIAAACPWCEVEVATRLESRASQADVIVTGLSGPAPQPFPLQDLRPGCVVCDAGRPPSLDEEARRARPDVLFLRAGEIELPGPADLGADLGPPPKVAFASLAETVALSLSGRDECFTLGDTVSLPQVKEIYRLGLAQGMRLAGIRGIVGPLSATEIRQIRERAMQRLRKEPRA
jgi:predicted amino acid dehydrogenase